MARSLASRPKSRRRGDRQACALRSDGKVADLNRAGSVPRPAAPVRDLLAMLRRGARNAATGRERRALVRRETRHLFSPCRMIACYVAHVGAGVSLRAIAGATGRHPSTIASVVRHVEGHRDDAGFDRLVTDVEHLAAGGGWGGHRHG